MTAFVLITNCPDQTSAELIARAVVEQRLAACVNILAPCQSIYQWQGKIETAMEIPLLIKTTAASVNALQEAIAELHPYDVPEIIALPITGGLPAYLRWIASETGGKA